jgi:hypothetical protein
MQNINSSHSTITTYTSTITTTIFPPPTGLAKRDELPEPHRHQARDGFPPEMLGAPTSVISEACSSALATRTLTIYAVSTDTVTETLTQTSTAVDTIFTPATTATDDITDTATDSVPVTETITSYATLTIVPTVTVSAVSTVSVCPDQQSVDAGGILTSGSLNFLGSSFTALSCCQSCFGTDGCGLWFYFSGTGCFTGNGASGSNPDTQCPSGFGEYILQGPGGPGDLGGPGPCAGLLSD